MNTIEKKFSTGAISAVVWNNEGKDSEGKPTEFKTISIDRRYQDKDGNWKSTSSLRVNDLPKVVLVANKAFEYLSLKEDSEKL
ncbi:hypothetical protein KY321_02880 [Candidatus Woesearchaeota archaeon]|nr:hypothetical protein [Candidatus Woesearchaeota archaeon]